MDTETSDSSTKTHNWGLAGAVLAAIAASACCVGPFVLLLLGVSGAWIGGLSALEPFRPYLTGLTLAMLGLAFYRVYRAPRTACAPGRPCATRGYGRRTKVTLWISAAAVLGLLASPHVLPRVWGEPDTAVRSNTRTVTLAVENMTCAGCVATIRTGLRRLDGVARARVTLDPPRAEVTYDPSVLDVEDLIRATANLGYPSRSEAVQ